MLCSGTSRAKACTVKLLQDIAWVATLSGKMNINGNSMFDHQTILVMSYRREIFMS